MLITRPIGGIENTLGEEGGWKRQKERRILSDGNKRDVISPVASFREPLAGPRLCRIDFLMDGSRLRFTYFPSVEGENRGSRQMERRLLPILALFPVIDLARSRDKRFARPRKRGRQEPGNRGDQGEGEKKQKKIHQKSKPSPLHGFIKP